VRESEIGSEMRGLVRSIDPNETIWDVAAYDELLDDSVGLRRFTMLLTGLFAGVAFLLASIGVYGVMSYVMAQRTHEMGIRVALGAQKRDVLHLVLGQGARLATAGASVGIIAAVIGTRLLTSLLFGVTANDAATFVGVTVLLVSVALTACYVPARRAMRVDPMVALRYE
jgi:ABC-type antimicrobial peptide transport system permease subunit